MRAAPAESETTALPHRDEFHGGNLATHRARFVHHLGRVHVEASREEARAPLGRADEAHVLAVGLRGRAQPGRSRQFAHAGLVHGTHGEEHLSERVAGNHVHDVALVLGGVGAPHHAGQAANRLDTGVMPRGYGVETEHPAAREEGVELEVPIALDAGVRGLSPTVGRDVRADDGAGELVGVVEHDMVDADLLGHAPCVVHVRHRTAAGVALPAPQAQGHTHHLVASVAQQQCRGGGIHPARHPHEHLHRDGSRRRVAAAVTASTAASTSVTVVVWPKLRRSDPRALSIGTPIAART